MWWRSGVVYEVCPRSFQDTDGDGVGDLRGVADRLPYLGEGECRERPDFHRASERRRPVAASRTGGTVVADNAGSLRIGLGAPSTPRV